MNKKSDIITSGDGQIDFDPNSMIESEAEKISGGDAVDAAIKEFDELIDKLEKSSTLPAIPRPPRLPRGKFKRISLFVLKASSDKKFYFEAEIKHTASTSDRLTLKMVMPIETAIKMENFCHSYSRAQRKERHIVLDRMRNKMIYSNGIETWLPETFLFKTKTKKLGILQESGIEIKFSGLHEDKATVVMAFYKTDS